MLVAQRMVCRRIIIKIEKAECSKIGEERFVKSLWCGNGIRAKFCFIHKTTISIIGHQMSNEPLLDKR